MTTLDQLFRARLAVVVPDVVGAEAAAGLRARLAPRYTRYALVDRGSYDVVGHVAEPELFGALVEIASATTGRTLAVTGARALRLRAGDYLLARHDAVHDDECVEVTLDASAAGVPEADVYYRRAGDVYFRFPSAPGALAIVERDAAITCNHGYVSKLRAGAEIVRIVVRLADERAAAG